MKKILINLCIIMAIISVIFLYYDTKNSITKLDIEKHITQIMNINNHLNRDEAQNENTYALLFYGNNVNYNSFAIYTKDNLFNKYKFEVEDFNSYMIEGVLKYNTGHKSNSANDDIYMSMNRQKISSARATDITTNKNYYINKDEPFVMIFHNSSDVSFYDDDNNEIKVIEDIL